MKNVFYISNLDLNKNSGVEKKIKAQIKAFKNLKTNVFYIATKENDVYYCNQDEELYIGKVSNNKILRAIQLIIISKKIVKEKEIDLIYTRYMFSTPFKISLFKIAKKKKIKIVEEIPTYPYDEEFKRGKRIVLKVALAVDKCYRRKLKKYLDYIVTFSEDEEIFKIETIKIDNGVDVDKIQPIDIKYNKNKIDMIAVSAMEYWQGYDRLIKAINNYYINKDEEDPEIIIHLVGDGTELENLKQLVKDYKLTDKVIFYGFLSGDELDKVYEKCQCAIAGLGIFRKNVKTIRTLKVREYISKAIPFVYATTDKSIIGFKYGYEVSNDEEIFSMKDVLMFLDNLNKESIKAEMREFAEKNFKWEIQMKKVLDKVF